MNQIRRQPSTLPTNPWPVHTEQLTEWERLTVRAFRLWVNGLQHQDYRLWNDVWNTFLGEFGARDGKLALTWSVRMINILQGHAHRRLRYHQPGCSCVGGDERFFVNIVAACQNGEAMIARQQAGSLVPSAAIGDLVAAAGQLALVLSARQCRLPLRVAVRLDIDLLARSMVSTAIN